MINVRAKSKSSLLCGKLAWAVVVVRREGKEKELMAARSIGQ